MQKPLPALALAALAAPTPAAAQSTEELAELREQVAELRAEVEALRAAAPDASWARADREEEVRRIADEAIADAGAGPRTAGHDGNRFFLAGGDARLEISGLLQVRHVALETQGEAEADDAAGFEVRRARLAFGGHVVDEALTYFVQLDAGRDGGDIFLLDAQLQWELDNGIKLRAGRFKLPFLYEELLSAARLLGVDRSQTHGFFTLGRTEQVQVVVPVADRVRLSASFSDGGNRAATGALNDRSDWALTGRAQGRLLGGWDQLDDLVAWEQGPTLFLGVAGHAQDLNDNQVNDSNTLTAWTADAVFKAGRFAGLAAYAGAGSGTFEAHGFNIQAGVNVTEKVQPFARYDWIDNGVVDPLQALTAGVNWYLSGQTARLTTDVVWIFEAPAGFGDAAPSPLNNAAFSSGLGLTTPTGGDEVAIRTQVQLIF